MLIRKWLDMARSVLVLAAATGSPIEPRNLDRPFYTIRERAGLNHLRVHNLRHACVTLLLPTECFRGS